MKSIFLLLILCLSSVGIKADVARDGNPLNTKENRLIEPTSPVLGYDIAQFIKASTDHPEIIFANLKSDKLKYDMYLSAHTYLKTLRPGLNDYCAQNSITTKNRSRFTEVEHAAIPLEVLMPLHESYQSNFVEIEDRNLSIDDLHSETLNIAKSFQNRRYNCQTALKIRALEDKLEKFCLGLKFCKNAKKINQILSSAEAAYPRLQYSVNGFTRYVYGELLKEEDLESNLKTIYNLELEWLNDESLQGEEENSLFQYVTKHSLEKGIHAKTIFLILAYSMRNMPSLDIEYAINPEKALLLETYFWSFKDIKKRMGAKEVKSKIYANYTKSGLGVYHYLTASLLSCESRLAGQGSITAVLLGYFSKLGYKLDKLLKAIDKEKYEKEGFKYVRSLAKKQGFKSGLDAGEYGGKFGSKICGNYYKDLKKAFKAHRKEIRKKYSIHVRRGYRRIGPPSQNRRRSLRSHEKELRVKYLAELELAKKEFEKMTRSVLAEDFDQEEKVLDENS